MERQIKFEYGFQSVNGIIKKQYFLSEIPSIKNKCDVWGEMAIVYVRQWTGLQDKNGTDIFEHDIIQYDNGTKAKVIFKEGAFIGYDGYAISSDEAYLLLVCEDSSPFDENKFELEVIGNVHEHPEKATI